MLFHQLYGRINSFTPYRYISVICRKLVLCSSLHCHFFNNAPIILQRCFSIWRQPVVRCIEQAKLTSAGKASHLCHLLAVCLASARLAGPLHRPFCNEISFLGQTRLWYLTGLGTVAPLFSRES